MSYENGTTAAPERASNSCNRAWCVMDDAAPEEHYDHHASASVTLGEDEVWLAHLIDRDGEEVRMVLMSDDPTVSFDEHGRFEIQVWQLEQLVALLDDPISRVRVKNMLRWFD